MRTGSHHVIRPVVFRAFLALYLPSEPIRVMDLATDMHTSLHRLFNDSTWRLGFALVFASGQLAHAADLSYNTGSLGIVGDGTNTAGVVLNQPGAVAAFWDYASGYSANNRTTVPFLSQLNPPASSSFTIEFWARPTGSDNDDACISNRYAPSGADRSGWVFFQRAAATGWTFRMYNGVGSGVGWEVEGGTATLDAWSHVVAVWNGTSAKLYVNGALVDESNLPSASGSYNPNISSNSVIFSVGALFDGLSPYNGLVDEVAFYPTALAAPQVLNHFNAASSATAGAYSALVLADGAIEYLQQNPPVARIAMIGQAPRVTFTGILAQSTDLVGWTDLNVTSPYTPPSPLPKQFFRAHR